MKNFIINSQQEMAILAQEIARSSKVGEIIGINGTLGAGKSFFARNFINSLSNQEQTVTSPTFN